MSADLLRKAAAKIRETAQATGDEGGWYSGRIGLAFLAHNLDPQAAFDEGVPATAAHIALWSPDAALMIADWLDGSASDLEYGGSLAACDAPGVVQYHVDFARLVLGESS